MSRREYESHRAALVAWLFVCIALSGCGRTALDGMCARPPEVSRMQRDGTVFIGPPARFGTSTNAVCVLADDTALVAVAGSLTRIDRDRCVLDDLGPVDGEIFGITAASDGTAYAYGLGLDIERSTILYRIRPDAQRAERLPTPPFAAVRALVGTTEGPRRLRVVDSNCAIFESSDDAASWRSIAPGPRDVSFSPAASIDPTDLDHIACAQGSYLLRVSFDGGRSWESSTMPELAPDRLVRACAISPVDGHVVWALRRLPTLLSPDYHLVHSDDGGRTFTLEVTTDQVLVDALVPDRLDASRVVFASETGVHWYDRNEGDTYVSSNDFFGLTRTSEGMEWHTIRSFDVSAIDGSAFLGLTHSTICEPPCRLVRAADGSTP